MINTYAIFMTRAAAWVKSLEYSTEGKHIVEDWKWGRRHCLHREKNKGTQPQELVIKHHFLFQKHGRDVNGW